MTKTTFSCGIGALAVIALLPELKLVVIALRAYRYNQASRIVVVPLSLMKRNMGDSSQIDECDPWECAHVSLSKCASNCRSSSKKPKIQMNTKEAQGDKAKLDFITAALGDQEHFGQEPERDCQLVRS